MNVTKSVYVDVDVDVDASDFDDDELVAECEKRGFTVCAHKSDPWRILADAYHFGRDPERVLADLIYENTGRIVEPRKH